MSKAKGKKKQNQPNSAQQELLEQQKREILEQSFTIKRLQDRLSQMTQENHNITSTKDKFQQQYEQKIDKQRIIIESHQNNIKQNRGKIYDLEVTRMTMENKIKDLQRQLRQLQQAKNRQFDQYRRVTQKQITKFEIQLKQYTAFMDQRDHMNYENQNLKKIVENEKQDKIRQVADKQREKVQALDRLKDEMLNKIKDMRSNLLSLKKEQLDTTTRLAVLQNHQLTSQLQFQSKQSQKLIFQNEQLTKKISHLQKDLQIHKQIQDELAKRSHYSRGIIKKLTSRIAQLQQQLKHTQEQDEKRKHEKDSVKLDSNKKQEVIRTLDKTLQNSQKKYIKLVNQSEATKNQLQVFKSKLEDYEKKINAILQILLKSYEEFEEGRLSGISGGYQIDLNQLRKKNIEEWTRQQLRLVVNALIQQISTFINKKTLGLLIPPKLDQPSVLDSDQTINNIKLPKLSEHSTNSKLQLSMKLKQLPLSLGSKLVGSQVRDWGRTVHSSSHLNLVRKYKVYDK